jgi:hypothetical protein
MGHPKVRESLVVAAIYVLAHGLMLLDRGLFWDDWIYFRQPHALLVTLGRELGSTWPSATSWLPYGSWFSIWATRAVMFACFLGVALLALRLSRRLPFFDSRARIAFASLVAVFPAMSARASVSTFIYPISLLLFMCGWALLDHVIDMKGWRSWVARLTALFAFFLSFRTASLGMFYLVVIVWVLWRSGATWRRPREAMSVALRWPDLVIMPVGFWVYRSFYGVPSGFYENYNTLTLSSFLSAPRLLPRALSGSLIDAFTRMPMVAWWPVVVVVALVAGSALLWSRVESPAWRSPRSAAKGWLATAGVGLLLVALGVYPYLAVDKVPGFRDFDSRHQLLVPFGAALILVGLIRALSDGARLPRAVEAGLFALVIALCAGTVAGDHLSYQREWYKQLGMITQFQQAPQMRDGRSFVFDDQTKRLNINGRVRRRFYEYAGLFEQAFGTHDRFGADQAEFARTGMQGFRGVFMPAFKSEDVTGTPPQYVVTIRAGSVDLRSTRVLAGMLWDDWTGAPGFSSTTAATVQLTFQPLR